MKKNKEQLDKVLFWLKKEFPTKEQLVKIAKKYGCKVKKYKDDEDDEDILYLEDRHSGHDSFWMCFHEFDKNSDKWRPSTCCLILEDYQFDSEDDIDIIIERVSTVKSILEEIRNVTV